MIVLVGLLAGLLSGVFGIGGGVLIVPGLVEVVGMPMKEATGTSLAAMLPPVGILGGILYYRKNLINIKAGLLIAAGLMGSVFFGAKIADCLPEQDLKVYYGFFLLYISFRFINPRALVRAFLVKLGKNVAPIHVFDQEREERQSKIGYLLLGIVSGIIAGLFGIGGGAIIIPALVGLFHYCPKRAAGTSLGVLLLPIGLPGVLVYAEADHIQLYPSVVVALGLLIGTLLGARLAVGLSAQKVKLFYGFFLLFTSTRYIAPWVMAFFGN